MGLNEILEFILKTYLFQILLIIVGLVFLFVGVGSREQRDQAGSPAATGKKKGKESPAEAGEGEAHASIQFWPPKIPSSFLPRSIRLALIVGGIVLVLIGVVLVGIDGDSTVAPTETPYLVSMRYMVDDFAPRMVDLRTASTSGLPINKGQALRLYDFWVWVPEDAPGYKAKIEVYAQEERIGSTEAKSMDAGIIKWDELGIEDYRDTGFTERAHWTVQSDWETIEVAVVVYRDDERVSSSTVPVRLADDGASWLFDAPNLSFVSIVYSVNEGPLVVLDTRVAPDVGIEAQPDDTLTIHEVWYRSNAASDQLVKIEAFLSAGDFDPITDASTQSNEIQKGINPVLDVAPLTWKIPENRERLVLWLLRHSGEERATIMEELEVPLNPDGSSGLVEAGQEPLAASLTGLRYLIPAVLGSRMVDLRTASTSGIPVKAGEPLHFFDLWVWVPQGTRADEIQSEVFANGQQIGYTDRQPIAPGATQLGNMTISDYVHDEYDYAWQVQDDWVELMIFLVTYSEGIEVGRTYTTIGLNPDGTAWLLDPPNLSFVSMVYSINDGPQMVLDLRQEPGTGLNARQGDKVTLQEIWFHSNANSRDPRVEVEAYLESQSGGWSTHKFVADDIYWGINQLSDLPSFSWEVPSDDDALILLLSRMGEGGTVVMQTLWLPFGAHESPGLVPASEAVLWPSERSTFLDFEEESDLTGWSEGVQRSSDYSFSGNDALEIPVNVTGEKVTFMRWDQRFRAQGLAAHYYLPSEPDVQLSYIQFCILWEGRWNCECNSLEKERDRWHTVVLDLSTCHQNAEPPWDQPWNELELTGLAMQGSLSAPDATEPVSYTLYVDAIQIFDRESP